MDSKSRVRVGALLGGLTALVYSLVAENINQLYMPDIPLYNQPPGTLLRLITTLAAGVLIGIIIAWPDDSIIGVLLGAVGFAFFTSLAAARSQGWSVFSLLILFAYTFLPRAAMSAPVSGLLRWACTKWQETEAMPLLLFRKRAITIFLLVALAAFGGYFNLHNADERFALERVNNLVKQGVQAQRAADLPEELANVPNFLENGRGGYTLQTNEFPDTLAAQRPVVSYGTIETLVIVRFDNQYVIGCVDSVVYKKPVCWIY